MPNKSKIKNSWKCINGFRHAIHRMLRILFHGRLAPYESAKINAEPFIECCAEPFIALRAIHVGLAPNKSKIKNSWKCINAQQKAMPIHSPTGYSWTAGAV